MGKYDPLQDHLAGADNKFDSHFRKSNRLLESRFRNPPISTRGGGPTKTPARLHMYNAELGEKRATMPRSNLLAERSRLRVKTRGSSGERFRYPSNKNGRELS
jgi:hypothetical protein